MNKGVLIGGIILILGGVFMMLTARNDQARFLTGVVTVLINGVVMIIFKVKGN